MRDKLTPKMRPDAPLVICSSCDGKREFDCPECLGAGRLCSRGWEWDCEFCLGKQTVQCVPCEGEGSYPDPEAVLECPRCESLIDDETSACVAECGYVFEDTTALLLRDLCAKALAARKRREREKEEAF